MSERDTDSWSWSKVRFWLIVTILILQLNSCMDQRELRDVQRRVGQLEQELKR